MHPLLSRIWSSTLTISQIFIHCHPVPPFPLRACHGTRCDTWSERFSMAAAWLTTMTSGSSTPLLRFGSVRTCLDLLSTSTKATASRNAPVLTTIWHTFRWVASTWMTVNRFITHLAPTYDTTDLYHRAAKTSLSASEKDCCLEDFMYMCSICFSFCTSQHTVFAGCPCHS